MTCSSASSASATSPPTRPPGRTPTEAERIKAMVAIALKAEEVGLDVFATGEHHNPPFVPSSPTTMLGYIAARTEKLILSTVDHADHHERPGEDRRGLRDAAAPGRRPGRPDDGPRQHRPGLPVVRPGHHQGHRARGRELPPAAPAVARGRRELEGPVPHPAAVVHLDAAPARRRPAVRLARLDPQPGDRRAGRVLRRRLLRQPHLLADEPLPAADRAVPRSASSTTATARRTRRSSVSAGRCSCGRTRRTRSGSSGRTSTMPRSTATVRRSRTSRR